jgi:hypothetical protein
MRRPVPLRGDLLAIVAWLEDICLLNHQWFQRTGALETVEARYLLVCAVGLDIAYAT